MQTTRSTPADVESAPCTGSPAAPEPPPPDGERRTGAPTSTPPDALNHCNGLQALMDALPIAVSIVDVNGGSVASNGAYDDLWGSPRPQARSVDDYAAYKAWWAATGKPVLPEEWASARAVLHGETVVDQELEIQQFNGSRQFILNSAAPLRDASGRIVGSVVAIQVITALKEAEAELRTRHAELEAFTRAMVGRELRMIELKREVNALCARLGEPTRYREEQELPQV